MHNERVPEISFEASMKFQAQEVHSGALRDELIRLESELARSVADRVNASFVADPAGALVVLQHKLWSSGNSS